MSVNQDSPVEPQNDKDRKVGNWGRWSLTAASLLIILVAIVFALRPVTTPSVPTSKDSTTLATPVNAGRRNPHIGPLDAPVTIVEFGDFACPACGVWNQSGTLQKVLDKYGDKVRFVWADFPSITPDSSKAAEGARCAYDQNKFWEYHDYLYSHMEAIGVNDLKVYASILGLDRKQFDQCLDQGARAEEISNDFRDAVARRVGSLPTFYVNEVRLVGPLTLEQLSAVIDPILTKTP
ncbi:MAG: thioredoxin domain-containing protein [Chloroflexota bacterium]